MLRERGREGGRKRNEKKLSLGQISTSEGSTTSSDSMHNSK